MARVNVETRALAESRLTQLMKLMRWRRSTAIGTLVLIWHDSQERLVVKATKKQIMMWSDPKDEKEGEKLFAALVECEYLEEVEGSLFRIRGNTKHVESNAAMREQASAAGRASAEARKIKKLAQQDANGRLQEFQQKLNDPPTEVEPNTIQCNTIHNNSVQNNAKQSNSKLKLAPSSEQLVLDPSGLPAQAPAGAGRGVVDELKGDEVADLYFDQVTKDTQKAWLKAYPDSEWIIGEVLKANVWIKTNPHKKPKQFARFMSNWLSRAYENYRKGLPSNYGMNSEGFYMTPEMKRSHNNNLRMKNMTGKNIQEITELMNGDSEERTALPIEPDV